MLNRRNMCILKRKAEIEKKQLENPETKQDIKT